MKLFKVSLVIVSASLILFACSKNSSSDSSDTSSLIVGNWTVQNREIKGFLSGNQVLDSVVTDSAGDYAIFNANGTLYTQIQKVKDTSTYALLGSNKISFDYQGSLDTFSIATISQTNCLLSYTSPAFDTTIIPGIVSSVYGMVNISLTK